MPNDLKDDELEGKETSPTLGSPTHVQSTGILASLVRGIKSFWSGLKTVGQSIVSFLFGKKKESPSSLINKDKSKADGTNFSQISSSLIGASASAPAPESMHWYDRVRADESILPPTTKLIALDPNTAPECSPSVPKKPDGVGLQILFKVEIGEKKEHFIIMGNRSNKGLQSVNGGNIEEKDKTYLQRITEELNEETFGVMQIKQEGDRYYLQLNNDGRQKHLLSFCKEAVFDHKPESRDEKDCVVDKGYTYITFTATCSALPAKQLKEMELKEMAKSMTPTARFWNDIGSHLYSCAKQIEGEAKQVEDEAFRRYWESQQESRKKLIEKLTDTYNTLSPEDKLLAEHPLQVFKVRSIQEVFAQLNSIDSHEALKKLLDVVGSYSERSSYHLLNAREVLTAAKTRKKIDIFDRNKKLKCCIFKPLAVLKMFQTVIGDEAVIRLVHRSKGNRR